MISIDTRPAEPGDAAAIAGLMTQLGYRTTGPEMRRRLETILADTHHATFVAETGDRVVGMIGICVGLHYARDGAYGRIVALSVDSSFRRRGIGGLLVGRAELWARSRGGARIIVNTRAAREDAHRFYRSLGYRETGLRFVKHLD